ncbi:MAG: cobalamin biosynthesis protein [Desulfovibrionaceae bacterium]|nr:cobalamin biosynthesis protein [Desulfovibrionaceae bacterium]
MPTALACWVLNSLSLPLAKSLQKSFAKNPWREITTITIFAPQRFCPIDCLPITKLKATFTRQEAAFAGHIFFGACGIAVRTIAPTLQDKWQDKPVIVVDPTGQYVISLLAGHWGGGNSLSKHIASLLKATPIITTASDAFRQQALDLLIQKANLQILDADCIPKIQAILIEGGRIKIYDPLHFLGDISNCVPCSLAELKATSAPRIAISYHKLPKLPHLLRLVPKCLALGLGFCKHTSSLELALALEKTFEQYGIYQEALFAIASITQKTTSTALLHLASHLHLPIYAYSAEDLALVATPTPSLKAGQIFKQKPFSVAEAAALLTAKERFKHIALLGPKMTFDHHITLALAQGNHVSN